MSSISHNIPITDVNRRRFTNFIAQWQLATKKNERDKFLRASEKRQILESTEFNCDSLSLEEQADYGFHFLKYYYFQPNHRKRALQLAIQCLDAFINDDKGNYSHREEKGEAAFQLAWLYLYHPRLRYESQQTKALDYLEKAREYGHKRANRYYWQRKVATIVGHLSMAIVYALLVTGAFLMASAASLALPITAAITAGTVLFCGAHWLGFKYWHRISALLGDFRFSKYFGIFQHKHVNQGSPSAQLRDILLYNLGITADKVEAKRGGRYAQLPKGALAGVFFVVATLFFFPTILTMPWLVVAGLVALTIAIAMASADTNRRVFTAELYELTERSASPEDESTEAEANDHKLQRRIALTTNILYGICMGLTVLLVSATTLFGFVTTIATGAYFLPAMLLLSPVFAIAAYASYVVGRGYFTLSLLTWINNIESNWQNWNLNKPLTRYQGEDESVSKTEKIFGVLGFVIGACVAICLTLLSVMELHLIFSWIPGANYWLIAGGTIGGISGIATTVLYVSSIVTAFRITGRALSNTSQGVSLASIANSSIDISTVVPNLFQNIKKSLTLGLNASGNSFISAVPAIKLLTGSIVAGLILPAPLVLPIAITVAALAGIASLCVCYVNWSKAMDAKDPSLTLAEQAYDRSLLNTIVDIGLSIPAALITAAVYGLKLIAKGGAMVLLAGAAMMTRKAPRVDPEIAFNPEALLQQPQQPLVALQPLPDPGGGSIHERSAGSSARLSTAAVV